MQAPRRKKQALLMAYATMRIGGGEIAYSAPLARALPSETSAVRQVGANSNGVTETWHCYKLAVPRPSA